MPLIPASFRTSTPDDVVDFEINEPAQPRLVRSPVTAVRLVFLAGVAGLAASRLSKARQANFETLLRGALSGGPRWLVSGLVGTVQLALLVAVALGIVALLLARRWRRLGRILVAAVLTTVALVLVSRAVGVGVFRVMPLRHLDGARRARGGGVRVSGYGIGSPFPTPLDLGVLAAGFLVDAENWSPRRRRWLILIIGGAVLARLGVGLAHPTTILTTLLAAGAAVQLVRLALGTLNTRPQAAGVGAKLTDLGYSVRSVRRREEWHTFTGYSVTTTEGQLFAKVVHRDDWASFLPARVYRSIRFRDSSDQHPLRSLRTGVEHEALCALKAHADGVPTARLAVMSEMGADAYLLAFDTRTFVMWSDLESDRRTPELFDRLWASVATLQRNRMVHGRLNATSVLVDEAGEVAIVEYGNATLSVIGDQLATDIAELLATTAVQAGAAHAVDAAVRGLGAPTVAAALPRLQPLALTPVTRAAVKRADVLESLRLEVQQVTGAEEAPIAELERVKPRTVLMVVAVAVALWTLIPQLAGSGAVWSKLADANWWWAALAIGLSLVTYVGAALSLDGSVNERLPFLRNVGVQVATSFIGVVAPGGVLALTGRFLRRRGVSTETAAGAVGVNTLAGGVVHLTLSVLFVAIAGTSGLKSFHLPALGTIGLIVAAIVAVAAIGVLVPWSRAIVVTRLWPAVRRSMAGIGEVLHDPTKVAELIGGSVIITLGYIAALIASVAAFGAGPPLTSIALVYLLGSVVSSIAPTPGGIGAVEATLIAGLTSAGMPSATAVASVLLFRMTTFWLPLLPGWLTFLALQRTGDL